MHAQLQGHTCTEFVCGPFHPFNVVQLLEHIDSRNKFRLTPTCEALIKAAYGSIKQIAEQRISIQLNSLPTYSPHFRDTHMLLHMQLILNVSTANASWYLQQLHWYIFLPVLLQDLFDSTHLHQPTSVPLLPSEDTLLLEVRFCAF